MAGKARVHELAKELGVTSKELLARLKEQGEFVKSASSTVEAPVARRLRESFPSANAKPEGGESPRPSAKPGATGASAPSRVPRAPAPSRHRPPPRRPLLRLPPHRAHRPPRPPRTASGTGTHAGSQARPAGSCGAGSGRSGCVSGPGRPQARRSAPRPQAAARR
ncbi:hypothetical protein GS425_03770 [Rhodococcus hoagii]|nr:hypothetical protein [Prescottella equi]